MTGRRRSPRAESTGGVRRDASHRVRWSLRTAQGRSLDRARRIRWRERLCAVAGCSAHADERDPRRARRGAPHPALPQGRDGLPPGRPGRRAVHRRERLGQGRPAVATRAPSRRSSRSSAPGEFFGELAILDGAPHSATIVAVEPTETLVLHRDAFLGADRHRAGAAPGAARVARDRDPAADRPRRGPPLPRPARPPRVADPPALASSASRTPDGAVRITWPYTQSELAGMIGGSRQSVNRLLADLDRPGPRPARAGRPRRHRRRAARAHGRAVTGPTDGDATAATGATGRRRPTRALDGLRAVALRVEAGRRLAPPAATAVLRSIVEATVALFDAEAASIALYDPATGPARLRGRGRRARARASSAWRSRPTRASPATSSRPASRWRCPTSRSDAAVRPGGRRADRLRAAVARRGAARRRRGHDRRPRGPRQARRGGVRPARHRARLGLRPPGDGRDPGQPASSATRRRCSVRRRRDASAATAPATPRDVDAIVADAVADARRARTTARCGPWPTRSPASAPPIRPSSSSSASCSAVLVRRAERAGDARSRRRSGR